MGHKRRITIERGFIGDRVLIDLKKYDDKGKSVPLDHSDLRDFIHLITGGMFELRVALRKNKKED